ncbi:MAG TPA: hypothetical protein PK977_02660 [Chitinophagaceae bacterium]|nr:hypothetical protein [Chitinophagaceae bacterium]HRF17034.1 hypothetical protein [Chitinophagaceae bacterium]
MIQIKNYLFAGLAIFTISSCSKNNTDVIPPVTQELKKTIKTSTINGNISFEFGPEGKPKQFIVERPWGSYRYDFIYEPAKATINVFNIATNQKEETYQASLNDKGHITQLIFDQYDNNGNPTATATTSYSYNAKGLLEMTTSPSSFSKKYYYDTEGNNIKTEYYNGSGQLINYTENDYSDKLDKCPAHNINQFTWQGFFLPALSKKLLNHKKQINAGTNTINFEIGITYELDAEGFVKKGMVDDLNPAGTDWSWTFTFDK